MYMTLTRYAASDGLKVHLRKESFEYMYYIIRKYFFLFVTLSIWQACPLKNLTFIYQYIEPNHTYTFTNERKISQKQ